MPVRCLLYYITDRTAFAPDEPTRRRRLLEKIAEAARAGIDYIQLREKDLTARELEVLAQEAARTVYDVRKQVTEHLPLTAVLINSRADVAIAAGADGVHLRGDDISPPEVHTIWKRSTPWDAPSLAAFARHGNRGATSSPLIAVSCHSAEEVVVAEENGADLAVFAPVFEKKDAPGTRPAGLPLLREACRAHIPVLALGGITLENAKQCFDAGAAGIAAIRLFQENDVSMIVRQLRESSR